MDVPPLVAYIAAWIGLGAGVFALFERGESVLRPEVKDDISRWLRNLDPVGIVRNWPSGFVKLFDSVFGDHHLSWRCFARSCIASLLAILTASTLLYALKPSAFTEVFGLLFRPPWEKDWLFGRAYVPQLGVGILVVGANLLGDYASLLETRYLLQWMSKLRSGVLIGIAILVDVIATIAIWTLALTLSAVLIDLLIVGPLDFQNIQWGSWNESPLTAWDALFSLLEPTSWSEDIIMTLALLGAAFFTSLWLWLYASAAFLVRAAHAAGKGLRLVKGWFDIENKPLRSIGMVCDLAITAGFVVGILL